MNEKLQDLLLVHGDAFEIDCGNAGASFTFNPHTAVAIAQTTGARSIIWHSREQLGNTIQAQNLARARGGRAIDNVVFWQAEHPIDRFINRTLRGFAPANSKVWQE